jgi:hypothetical protein
MPFRTDNVHVAATSRSYKGKVYHTRLIRRALAGEKLLPASQAFLVERDLPHGHVQAALGVMRRLGLDTLLASKSSRQRDLPSP